MANTFKPRNWQPNEIITHDDLNRLEQGVEEALSLIKALRTEVAPKPVTTARKA